MIVITGDGQDAATLPASGAANYWPSLSAIAALFVKGIKQSNFVDRAIYVGAPESGEGVYIGAEGGENDYVDVPIPPQLVEDFGLVCIPMLMVAFGTAADDSRIWMPVTSYDFDAGSGGNSIGVAINNGGSTIPNNVARVHNTYANPVFVRGYLYFPKRNDNSVAFRIL